MSHSTVLVIGEKPEEMLAPYDENLEVEPYRDYEDAEKPADHWTFDILVKEQGLAPDADWLDFVAAYNSWYRDSDEEEYFFDADRQRMYHTSTYNPKSRWDWYQLGGRWTGFYALRPGTNGEVGQPGVFTSRAEFGRVDQARKRDIDFDAMRAEIEREAADTHAKVRVVLDGFELPKTWAHVREVMYPGDIDAARAFYHNQAGIQALRIAKLDTFDCPITRYHLDRPEPAASYIAERVQSTGLTFAVLNDDGWHERGRMGWWGVVHDESDDWPQVCRALIDAAPDDALFSVFDVHI